MSAVPDDVKEALRVAHASEHPHIPHNPIRALSVAQYYTEMCEAVDAVHGAGYAKRNPGLLTSLCQIAAKKVEQRIDVAAYLQHLRATQSDWEDPSKPPFRDWGTCSAADLQRSLVEWYRYAEILEFVHNWREEYPTSYRDANNSALLADILLVFEKTPPEQQAAAHAFVRALLNIEPSGPGSKEHEAHEAERDRVWPERVTNRAKLLAQKGVSK